VRPTAPGPLDIDRPPSRHLFHDDHSVRPNSWHPIIAPPAGVLDRRDRGCSRSSGGWDLVEAVSVIRRQLANGALSTTQATNAIEDLLNLPIIVYPTAALLRRAWELRHNATAYDACYVALAEALGCSLATADQRLANAPGARCQFDIV
jgi:predicted nucleic acid-binding protein